MTNKTKPYFSVSSLKTENPENPAITVVMNGAFAKVMNSLLLKYKDELPHELNCLRFAIFDELKSAEDTSGAWDDKKVLKQVGIMLRRHDENESPWRELAAVKAELDEQNKREQGKGRKPAPQREQRQPVAAVSSDRQSWIDNAPFSSWDEDEEGR